MILRIGESCRGIILHDSIKIYYFSCTRTSFKRGLYYNHHFANAKLSMVQSSKNSLTDSMQHLKIVSSGYTTASCNRSSLGFMSSLGVFAKMDHVRPSVEYSVYPCSKRNFSGHIDISRQGWLYKGLYDSPPVLYAQEFLLKVHDFSGLPWWATIIVSTVALRTTVTFPLALYQNYILAKLEVIQLQLKEISKEMGKETSFAVKQFNWNEKQAKAIYIRSMKKQYRKLIEKENCHPAKAGLLVLVQLPMWVSLSLALRNLVFMLPTPDAAAQVTLLEMSGGGAMWFHNLVLPDSTWILPVIMGLINLTLIEIQNLSRTKQPGKLQKTLTNVFRGVSIVMVPIAASVPSCLSLYWVTSSSVGLIHNLILLSPRLRQLAGIPRTDSVSQQPYKYIYTKLAARMGLSAPTPPPTAT